MYKLVKLWIDARPIVLCTKHAVLATCMVLILACILKNDPVSVL